MSNAANEQPTSGYSPWSKFDPPADLPDELKDVHAMAADLIFIARSFCLNPDRFKLSQEQLSQEFDLLKQTRNGLASWVIAHEVELRAEAPEALLAFEGILGVVQPLLLRLGGQVLMLHPRAPWAADPNHAKHLHPRALEGISVSADSLTPLRQALSMLAKRRESANREPGATNKAKKRRGRPGRSETRKNRQAEIASKWKRFWESKCWEGKEGTPKAQFCEQEEINREDLDTALRRASERKSKPTSATKQSKVGGK